MRHEITQLLCDGLTLAEGSLIDSRCNRSRWETFSFVIFGQVYTWTQSAWRCWCNKDSCLISIWSFQIQNVPPRFKRRLPGVEAHMKHFPASLFWRIR